MLKNYKRKDFTKEIVKFNGNLNEHLVFGSNNLGRHGSGSALAAHKEFDAEYGVGFGPTGRSYAICTTDFINRGQIYPLSEIKKHIKEFFEYAKTKPKITFHFTKIGTNLAGYSIEIIASLFEEYENEEIPSNVILPYEFVYFKLSDKVGLKIGNDNVVICNFDNTYSLYEIVDGSLEYLYDDNNNTIFENVTGYYIL